MTTTTTEPLAHLWQSTADLFLRFFGRPPQTSAQLRVVHEEVYELTEAALGSSDNIYRAEWIASEAADVIVTVLGVCQSCGVTYAELADAIERVATKNDGKTGVTHEVNSAGKIARRAVQP